MTLTNINLVKINLEPETISKECLQWLTANDLINYDDYRTSLGNSSFDGKHWYSFIYFYNVNIAMQFRIVFSENVIS